MGRRFGVLWLVVTICLLLAVAYCGYEVVQKKDREHARLVDQIQALEARQQAIDGRIAYLRTILAQKPCAAQAKWKMP